MSVKFQLGQTVITPNAQESLNSADIQASLRRHAEGDWGNCGPNDWAENDFSLFRHLRLLSVYEDRHGTTFWVITEADRSATTVLLPEEY